MNCDIGSERMVCVVTLYVAKVIEAGLLDSIVNKGIIVALADVSV
jgi:hypothetical protein